MMNKTMTMRNKCGQSAQKTLQGLQTAATVLVKDELSVDQLVSRLARFSRIAQQQDEARSQLLQCDDIDPSSEAGVLSTRSENDESIDQPAGDSQEMEVEPDRETEFNEDDKVYSRWLRAKGTVLKKTGSQEYVIQFKKGYNMSDKREVNSSNIKQFKLFKIETEFKEHDKVYSIEYKEKGTVLKKTDCGQYVILFEKNYHETKKEHIISSDIWKYNLVKIVEMTNLEYHYRGITSSNYYMQQQIQQLLLVGLGIYLAYDNCSWEWFKFILVIIFIIMVAYAFYLNAKCDAQITSDGHRNLKKIGKYDEDYVPSSCRSYDPQNSPKQYKKKNCIRVD